MDARKSENKGAPARQIVLPLGVALRIAYENIRMRLGRSLLTTSGIVLGVAFLTSIMVMNVMMRGMRDAAHQNPCAITLHIEKSDFLFEPRLRHRLKALETLFRCLRRG